MPATAPLNDPTARGYHAMVDLPEAGVLMVGGFNTSPPRGGHLLADFWTFSVDGGWQRLAAECGFEPCRDGYPDVVGHAVYDTHGDRVILVHDTGRGTFTLDTEEGLFEDMGVRGPAGAAGSALAFDAESARAVLFGGLDFATSAVNADTWSLEPREASWTRMSPAAAPGAGNYHVMAYDPVSDRMILFGGAASNDVAYGETWAYDLDSDEWVDLQPSVSPPARYYSDMVYDPVGRRMVMFGGTDTWASATFADTWAYNPATNEWTEIDGPGPSVRAWHSMAYDDVSGSIVLFGGGPVREDYQSDTWLFDVATSTWREWGPG